MAQKTKNKIRNDISDRKKEATPDQHSWPNLPHQLLCMIARKPTLMHNITSFGCVIKTWRSRPLHCRVIEKSPWPKLVEIDKKRCGIDHTRTGFHVIEIPFHEKEPYPYYKGKRCKSWHLEPGLYFKGHSHGQVVAFGSNFSECYVWEPFEMTEYSLPHWDPKLLIRTATLASRPYRPKVVMVLTGTSSTPFAFCRLTCCNRTWITENCTLKDPYAPDQVMQFTNAIGFEGKFYALSLQGSLVMIEDVELCFKITGVSAHRAVPSKVSRQYREYLVEVDGEILLVFLISRKSINLVDDAEVFRLDVVKFLWEKVESLGERSLFLEDECCMWVDAKRVGCKKNCIYFTHDGVDEWWVFDMENGSIVPTSSDEKFEKWSEPMELE